jgi:hypothetical protein
MRRAERPLTEWNEEISELDFQDLRILIMELLLIAESPFR